MVFSMKDQKSGHMVLKGVNWDTMIKSGHMVLKGVNWVQYAKQKINFKVSRKGVTWVHNDKIRSYDLERSNLGTQYKDQVIWS